MEGRRWEIQEAQTLYKLLLNASGGVDVFMSGVRPAVLRRAICRGTKAPGASLPGADLRGVRWYASDATLDHADLEGAALSGSLLLGTDFTQAYLSGADLSNCLLVQAKFRGCTVGSGEAGQQFSLEGSMLHGADFNGSTLLGALLVDTAVALTNGVPLLSLPASAEAQLTAGTLAPLAPIFSAAGYPLGASPTVAQVKIWFLDNSNSGDISAPKRYRVQSSAGQLNVSDATTGTSCFKLAGTYVSYLSSTTAPAAPVAAFRQQNCTLAVAVPITALSYWEVKASPDAPKLRATTYPTTRVYPGQQQLPVYGSVLLSLRDWTQYYSEPVAFAATQALDSALNPDSIGPGSHPRASRPHIFPLHAASYSPPLHSSSYPRKLTAF